MERLGRDEIFIIASKLKLLDLLNFCQVTRKIDNNLWIYKLKNELGFDYDEKNPKETYLKLYKELYGYIRRTKHKLLIHKPGEPITEALDTHDICYILLNPKTMDNRNVISIVSFIMSLNEDVFGNFVYFIIFFLFSWIANNLQLSKTHTSFKQTMKNKLIECKTIPQLIKIHEKFSWLLEI